MTTSICRSIDQDWMRHYTPKFHQPPVLGMMPHPENQDGVMGCADGRGLLPHLE